MPNQFDINNSIKITFSFEGVDIKSYTYKLSEYFTDPKKFKEYDDFDINYAMEEVATEELMNDLEIKTKMYQEE